MWLYNGVEFTSDMIKDYVGFVYIITHLSDNKKYIGKKLFSSKRTLPPLKGKKRKRKVVKESDWMSYYGSSDEVKELVEQSGEKAFKREILHLCGSKGAMSYLEMYEQVQRNVLMDDDYYNGIIQCKIHRSHVKDLKDKFID